MTGPDILIILQEMCILILKLSAPMVLTALILGVIISLVQAITQVQEMTLTFVAKFVAVLAVGLIVLPYITPSFAQFSKGLFERITKSGGDRH